MRALFPRDGCATISNSAELDDMLARLSMAADADTELAHNLRISQSVRAWREKLLREETRLSLRRDYEQKVRSGEYPAQETLVPLHPYRREGMLHLAFGGRVALDEAQRIKNWASKTAQAIKRLQSPFAFVLTGTPIENRLDELYSIISFLDPATFGPLFRFNREFYDLDDRGRPEYCRSLARVHERIRPLLLRRRKSDVETELPDRTDRNLFVTLGESQRADYNTHKNIVAQLTSIAKRRPLTKQQLVWSGTACPWP